MVLIQLVYARKFLIKQFTKHSGVNKEVTNLFRANQKSLQVPSPDQKLFFEFGTVGYIGGGLHPSAFEPKCQFNDRPLFPPHGTDIVFLPKNIFLPQEPQILGEFPVNAGAKSPGINLGLYFRSFPFAVTDLCRFKKTDDFCPPLGEHLVGKTLPKQRPRNLNSSPLPCLFQTFNALQSLTQARSVGDLNPESGARGELKDQRPSDVIKNKVHCQITQLNFALNRKSNLKHLIPIRKPETIDLDICVGHTLHRPVENHPMGGDSGRQIQSHAQPSLMQIVPDTNVK